MNGVLLRRWGIMFFRSLGSCEPSGMAQGWNTMTTMNPTLSRITIDPAICHGQPCVRGLRYPVELLLELLSSGMSFDKILGDYDDLERGQLARGSFLCSEAQSDQATAASGAMKVLRDQSCRVRRGLYLLAVPVALVFGLLYLATVRPDWMPAIDLPFDTWENVEEEVTDYTPPEPKLGDELVDDQLSEKNPAFIPDLIDRRPEGAWRINASAAVLRLDAPMLKPDADAGLLELRPSYSDAMANAPGSAARCCRRSTSSTARRSSSTTACSRPSTSPITTD